MGHDFRRNGSPYQLNRAGLQLESLCSMAGKPVHHNLEVDERRRYGMAVRHHQAGYGTVPAHNDVPGYTSGDGNTPCGWSPTPANVTGSTTIRQKYNDFTAIAVPNAVTGLTSRELSRREFRRYRLYPTDTKPPFPESMRQPPCFRRDIFGLMERL